MKPSVTVELCKGMANDTFYGVSYSVGARKLMSFLGSGLLQGFSWSIEPICMHLFLLSYKQQSITIE